MLQDEPKSLMYRATRSLEERERRIGDRRKQDRREKDDRSRVVSLYEEQRHGDSDEEVQYGSGGASGGEDHQDSRWEDSSDRA